MRKISLFLFVLMLFTVKITAQSHKEFLGDFKSSEASISVALDRTKYKLTVVLFDRKGKKKYEGKSENVEVREDREKLIIEAYLIGEQTIGKSAEPKNARFKGIYNRQDDIYTIDFPEGDFRIQNELKRKGGNPWR